VQNTTCPQLIDGKNLPAGRIAFCSFKHNVW
jgi:hypothetical protein